MFSSWKWSFKFLSGDFWPATADVGTKLREFLGLTQPGKQQKPWERTSPEAGQQAGVWDGVGLPSDEKCQLYQIAQWIY